MSPLQRPSIPSLAAAAALALALLLAPAAAHAAPPTCLGGAFLTAPDQSFPFQAEVCSDPDGDTFTVAIVDPPTHGAVGPGTNGGYVYIPEPGYHGYDAFSYGATDSNGEQSDPAFVDILVDSVPACTDARVVATSGEPVLIPLPCQDPDGDELTPYYEEPLHGTLEEVAGGFVYRSIAGYIGPDEFWFEVADPFEMFTIGSVSLTVVPAAARPLPTPAPAPAPAPRTAESTTDVTAPTVSLAGRTRGLDRVRSKGLRLTLETSEPGRATVDVTVSRATARKLGLAKRPRRPVTVGRLSTDLASGESTVRVTLRDKARRAIRKARKVELLISVQVVDKAGNVSAETLQWTLRR
jgi:hypothetical protein